MPADLFFNACHCYNGLAIISAWECDSVLFLGRIANRLFVLPGWCAVSSFDSIDVHIVSVSIADLLSVLTSIPLNTALLWLDGNWASVGDESHVKYLCKAGIYFQNVSLCISSLTLVIIAIDRWVSLPDNRAAAENILILNACTTEKLEIEIKISPSLSSPFPSYLLYPFFSCMQRIIVSSSCALMQETTLSPSFRRYIALCHPFLHYKYASYKRRITAVMTAIIWLLGLLIAVRDLVTVRLSKSIDELPDDPDKVGEFLKKVL